MVVAREREMAAHAPSYPVLRVMGDQIRETKRAANSGLADTDGSAFGTGKTY
jgi:hypothetical protein